LKTLNWTFNIDCKSENNPNLNTNYQKRSEFKYHPQPPRRYKKGSKFSRLLSLLSFGRFHKILNSIYISGLDL